MLRSVWLWISGFLLGILALLWALIFRKIRINKESASILYDLTQRKGRSFVLHEENTKGNLPTVYSSLCYLSGVLFKFLIEERFLRAGFSGTDSVVTITVFRWQISKLLKLIDDCPNEPTEISVYILRPWDAEKIGGLKIPSQISLPYLDSEIYEPLEKAVGEVIEGVRGKVGTILYGPPGNGKSYLARYLAFRFQLPIYLISFTPEINNHIVIRMFCHLKGPAIVLFEDFDTYFNGRKCLMKDAQFTLDTLLNILDGTFATMDGIISVMTCNDLDKIDPALSKRPGRFRYVLEIPNPSTDIRRRVFSDCVDGDKLADGMDGSSLDQLLSKRESLMIEKPKS